MTQLKQLRILEQHSMEVWMGYAVEQYTNGESFVLLSDLDTPEKLYNWLGY